MGCGCKSGQRNTTRKILTPNINQRLSAPAKPLPQQLLQPRPDRSVSGLDAERRRREKARRDAIRRLGKG